MALSPKQRSHLRGLAHSLNPVAMVGQHGVSEAVLAKIEQSLNDHELIKIRVASEDQTEFRSHVNEILEGCSSDLVQTIGHILVLYRATEPAGEVTLSLGKLAARKAVQ